MRLYLAATLPLLAEWVAAGAATSAGPAYAVTPALREWYRDGEIDELEHVAQVAAAGAAVELLAGDLEAPRRRVVLAVDVDDGLVRQVPGRPGPLAPGRRRAQVEIAEPVPRSSWAAALVDEPAAAPVVTTAVASVVRAGIGDSDAQFALDEAEAEELCWYAVQEIPYLLEQE